MTMQSSAVRLLLRTLPASAALVAVLAAGAGCEPSVDRGATARKPAESAAPSQPASTTVIQGSGSGLGKARDAAERTTDKVEQRQRDLEKQMEELGGG